MRGPNAKPNTNARPKRKSLIHRMNRPPDSLTRKCDGAEELRFFPTLWEI
jgi:hypothetical protein